MTLLAALPYDFVVAPTREAVAEAHRRVVTVARDWGFLHSDALADLKLCTAELAAHSFHEVGKPFVMRLCWTGQRARVEATDSSRHLPTKPNPGTGLHVVAQVAATSGVDAVPHGRLLWFEIAPDPLDLDRRLAARIRAAQPLVRVGALAVRKT